MGEPADSFLLRLQRMARERPGQAALIGPDGAVTAAVLAARVLGMAGWLHRQGLAPGEMVGVTIRDDAAHMVAVLALLRLGCHQIALPSHDPPALRAGLAARARVVAVIGDGPQDALPGVPLILPDQEEAATDAAALPDATGTAPVVVLTSSGTTGRPKLIPLTEAQILAQSDRRLGMGAVRHRPTGPEHNNGKRFALFALANRATRVLAPVSHRLGLPETCARFGVELLGLTPHQAEALLEAAPAAWPRGTAIDLAGAAPRDGLVERLQARLTRQVTTVYGATEVGTVTRAGPAEHARHPGSAGLLQPGCELLVVDERGRALPAGETGLLRMRSAGMAGRYLDDEAASAAAFVEGWFQPGDLGRLEADGTLFVAGRADDMMMLGTVNIFPAEIEQAAAGFPGLADCAAFPLRSAVHGDIPMLAVVPAGAEAVDAPALLAHCRARLGLRAPRKVVVVPSLPRNAAGKVLRRELAAMLQPGAGR